MFRLARILAASAAVAVVSAGSVLGQDGYPSRPIRLAMPFPPGSGIDIIARKAGPELAAKMGQPWVVENRPGGNSIIVAELCARAAPDGHTLCVSNVDMMSNNPHVFAKLPYDPAKDLKPVTNLYFLIEGIFVKADLPPNSVGELRAYALANPGRLNFGTLGPHSNPDMFREWLNGQWKTSIAGIHYKGGNLIIAALAAGEIDAAKIGAYNAIPQMKAKKVKLLALTSAKRLRMHPDVPTEAEVGLDGYGVRGWIGMVAPGGTPEAIARRVSTEIGRVFSEPAFAEFLDTQYVEPAVTPPEQYAAFLREDRDRAGRLVKQFNIPRQ